MGEQRNYWMVGPYGRMLNVALAALCVMLALVAAYAFWLSGNQLNLVSIVVCVIAAGVNIYMWWSLRRRS